MTPRKSASIVSADSISSPGGVDILATVTHPITPCLARTGWRFRPAATVRIGRRPAQIATIDRMRYDGRHRTDGLGPMLSVIHQMNKTKIARLKAQHGEPIKPPETLTTLKNH